MFNTNRRSKDGLVHMKKQRSIMRTYSTSPVLTCLVYEICFSRKCSHTASVTKAALKLEQHDIDKWKFNTKISQKNK